jgi:hypothetical protein
MKKIDEELDEDLNFLNSSKSNNVEHIGNRDAEMYFSEIIRKVGGTFIASNVDFVCANYKKRTMILLEHKVKGGGTEKYGQNNIYKFLDTVHKYYRLNKNIEDFDLETDFTYLGYFKIIFSNTTFENSKTVVINMPFNKNYKPKLVIDEEHFLKWLRAL